MIYLLSQVFIETFLIFAKLEFKGKTLEEAIKIIEKEGLKPIVRSDDNNVAKTIIIDGSPIIYILT